MSATPVVFSSPSLFGKLVIQPVGAPPYLVDAVPGGWGPRTVFLQGEDAVPFLSPVAVPTEAMLLNVGAPPTWKVKPTASMLLGLLLEALSYEPVQDEQYTGWASLPGYLYAQVEWCAGRPVKVAVPAWDACELLSTALARCGLAIAGNLPDETRDECQWTVFSVRPQGA